MASNKTLQPREQLTLEEARRRFLQAAEHNNRLAERWSLALAVGNGGGLLTITSKLMADDLAVAQAPALLGAAWVFAIGLLFAGLGPAFALVSATFSTMSFESLMKKAAREGSAGVGNTDWIYHTLFWLQVATEVIAAIAFAVGVLYPLINFVPPMPPAS